MGVTAVLMLPLLLLGISGLLFIYQEVSRLWSKSVVQNKVVVITDAISGLGKGKRASGFPDGSVVKNLPANAGDSGLIPGVGKIPCRREWQPTPVSLPGKSHGQRNLVGYSLWATESDTTEHAQMSFTASCAHFCPEGWEVIGWGVGEPSGQEGVGQGWVLSQHLSLISQCLLSWRLKLACLRNEGIGILRVANAQLTGQNQSVQVICFACREFLEILTLKAVSWGSELVMRPDLWAGFNSWLHQLLTGDTLLHLGFLIWKQGC